MEGSVKMEPAGAELSGDPYQINPEPKMFVDTIPCKRTLHIIELRKYYKQLKMLYQDLLKQREQNSIEEANKTLPSIPSMPETPELPQARTQMIPKSLSETMMYNLIRQNQGNDSPSSSNINQSYFEKSDFAQGIGEPPISISHPVAMHTLRKAVAAMLLLSGFDSATAPVLDHLTDAADGYMRKLCKSLNYNVFLKSYPEYTPEFPDALECTLQEEGVGSMSVIQKFYKVRIIQHHENMLSKCRNLRHECEMLRNSKIKATELPTGGTEAKVTEPLSNVVDEDNEPQPGPSASMSHGDEYKKGLFAQREIGSWPKDIMGPMLETGLLSNVDFSKDANIQGTAVHSVTSALEISQPMTDLLISGTNSPSSSVGSSRPAKVSRRKKKGRKGR